MPYVYIVMGIALTGPRHGELKKQGFILSQSSSSFPTGKTYSASERTPRKYSAVSRSYFAPRFSPTGTGVQVPRLVGEDVRRENEEPGSAESCRDGFLSIRVPFFSVTVDETVGVGVFVDQWSVVESSSSQVVPELVGNFGASGSGSLFG